MKKTLVISFTIIPFLSFCLNIFTASTINGFYNSVNNVDTISLNETSFETVFKNVEYIKDDHLENSNIICFTKAGNINAKKKFACIGDTIEINNNSFFLDGNDDIKYIISESKVHDLSKILYVSDKPEIWFDTLTMNVFQYYYIYAIAGNKNGSAIGIDTLDPCLTYSNVISVGFFYVPEFNFLVKDTTMDCHHFNATIVAKNVKPLFASEDYKYWSTVGGNILTIDTLMGHPTIVVDKNGKYSLKMFNWLGGCSYSKEIEINIQPEEPKIIIQQNAYIGCNKNSIQLDASGSSFGDPYIVRWTTKDGNIVSGFDQLNPVVEKTGTYYLTISVLNSSCSKTDSVIVSLVPAISVQGIEIKQPSCGNKQDGQITIHDISGGVTPYLFRLNGISSISNSFNGIQNGDFNLNITDSYGCSFDTMISLESPLFIKLDLGEDITTDWGDPVNINASLNLPFTQLDTLIWENLENASCNFCLQPEFIAKQSINIKAIAIKESCRSEDIIRLIVKKNHSVYIPNCFSPNADGINDKFVVFGGDYVKKVRRLEIFDRWGGQVFSTEDFFPDGQQGGWDGKLPKQYFNESVFVYNALIEFIDGDVEIYKGDITLLR